MGQEATSPLDGPDGPLAPWMGFLLPKKALFSDAICWAAVVSMASNLTGQEFGTLGLTWTSSSLFILQGLWVWHCQEEV